MNNYKYEKVYNKLKKDICDNYTVGDILPFDNELSKQYAVSLITIKTAMKMLVEDGIIIRKSGARTKIIEIPREPVYFSLIMCAFNSAFGDTIVYNFELLCHKNGYIPLISRTFDKSEIERKVIKQHIALGTSGIIIQPVDEHYNNPDLDKLYKTKFPIVAIDRPLHSIPCSLVTSNVHSNTIKLINYMSFINIKNVIIITPLYSFSSSTNNQRLVDIMAYTQEKNIDYHTVFSSIPNYEEHSTEWKKQQQELTTNLNRFLNLEDVCILCINYDLAKEVITVLNNLHHSEIEVTCFDFPNSLNKVHLTHILQDEKALISHSFQNMIIQYNGHTPINTVEIPTSFIVYDK